LFIQQLLDILYSFKEKKRYYVLKEILYEILSLEASIQGEKIVINNLQLDRLKLLLNEVLIAYLVEKITPTILFDFMTRGIDAIINGKDNIMVWKSSITSKGMSYIKYVDMVSD
jgi:hypothetical protein